MGCEPHEKSAGIYLPLDCRWHVPDAFDFQPLYRNLVDSLFCVGGIPFVMLLKNQAEWQERSL